MKILIFINLLFCIIISLVECKINSCGCTTTSKANNRIWNGFKVPPHSKPYQVYLVSGSSRLVTTCGGTVLNRKYILTAAHCVFDEKKGRPYTVDEIRVYLGQHNICQDMHRTKVEQLIIKNDYDGHNNDIALLKVAKMKFSSKVYPACLPTSNSDYTKKKGLVSGWGDTVSPSHGSPSCELRATKQTVLSSDDRSCTELTGYQVDKSKLCAFYPNTSGCPGDSGGPLIIEEKGKHTVVGIVSYGRFDCRSPAPGVYTRVSAYIDWITKNIEDGEC